MSAVLHAEVIRQAEPFAALEAEWWELWRRVAAATPFQSPAWLIPWWRCFHPGELFVVTVRAAGRLVGLAPFYVEDGRAVCCRSASPSATISTFWWRPDARPPQDRRS